MTTALTEKNRHRKAVFNVCYSLYLCGESLYTFLSLLKIPLFSLNVAYGNHKSQNG